MRINYRNTEEILDWSAKVLEGARIENLSGDGADMRIAEVVNRVAKRFRC